MPDDNTELIKAGAQGIAEGTMKPFSDLIQALFGPAATEAGLMLKDSVQRYRHMRRMRLLKRTQEVLANARIEPSRVALKLLIPIIENASNEEEDSLQDVWANLLSNAANAEEENNVHPSFPEILKELTGRDVKFLNALYLFALELCTLYPLSMNDLPREVERVENIRLDIKQIFHVYSTAGLAKYPIRPDTSPVKKAHNVMRNNRDAKLILDAFGRQGIFIKGSIMPIDQGNTKTLNLGTYYSFSQLGASFVKACSEPSPQPA